MWCSTNSGLAFSSAAAGARALSRLIYEFLLPRVASDDASTATAIPG
jgi:hypothetical protein